MKESIRTGFSFGLTSGIITTLGLLVGLHAGTHSKLAVVGGILTIAIADAFSDALGIHVSEEAEMRHTPLEVWESTFATFFTKFLFALTFLLPVLLLPLPQAVAVSIVWGLVALSIFSYHIAVKNEESPWKVVGEHLLAAVIVVIISHFVGDYISVHF